MFLDMGQIVLMFVMKWNGSRKKEEMYVLNGR